MVSYSCNNFNRGQVLRVYIVQQEEPLQIFQQDKHFKFHWMIHILTSHNLYAKSNNKIFSPWE